MRSRLASGHCSARSRDLRRSQSPPQPSERAWYAKETSPTAAIVLEALSRALPDGAYVTELRLETQPCA